MTQEFETRSEAVMRALEDLIAQGGGKLTVCVGEICPFEQEDVLENQKLGCPLCERFVVYGDGTVLRYKESSRQH